MDELPEELFATRNGETDDSNSKSQELQQLLESDTLNNLSSNKIHQPANPVAITGKDLSNPSSPTINNTNPVKSPALVSQQITTSSIVSPVPSVPTLSAAVSMNSQLHSISGTLNAAATPNSMAMTTNSSPNLPQNYPSPYNSVSPQGLVNNVLMARMRNGPNGNQSNTSLPNSSRFGKQMGDPANHINTALGNNTLPGTVKTEPNFLMGQTGMGMNQGITLGEVSDLKLDLMFIYFCHLIASDGIIIC